MLVNSANVRPEIQRMVDELLRESARYERELRSFHRDVLVCPVDVQLPNELLDIQQCFSRNISPMGISLVSQVEFPDRVIASLKVHRPCSRGKRQDVQRVAAECRWCKPFSDIYWVSGWQFIRLENNKR